MSRLLVSTLFRMLKKVVFWFFMLCMFSYGVYSASNIASKACAGVVLDGCLFEGLPLMGLVSAIFTSLFIGSEYSDGTIRNKLVIPNTLTAHRGLFLKSSMTCCPLGRPCSLQMPLTPMA